MGVGSLSFPGVALALGWQKWPLSVLVMGEPVMTLLPHDSIEKAMDCLGKKDDCHPSNGLSCSHQESREDFPGGAMDKNHTRQCREYRFGSLPGKIPHAVDQLNLCTTAEPLLSSPQAATAQPVCCSSWNPHAWSPSAMVREAPAMRRPRTTAKSSPCLLQLEKAHAEHEDPVRPKINK